MRTRSRTTDRLVHQLHPNLNLTESSALTSKHSTILSKTLLTCRRYIHNVQFSDITIRYGKKGQLVFHGHKVILASSSIWFQTAFSNPSFFVRPDVVASNMTPTNSLQETSATEITLHDDLPTPLVVLLKRVTGPLSTHTASRPRGYPPKWTLAAAATCS
jgi:hypothetical protein